VSKASGQAKRPLADPRPLLMWAAIVPTRRGSGYIAHHTIRSTRREARRAYEELWTPEFAPRAVKEHGITFARVIVEVV
jgi:hypothetical protein